MIHGIRWASQPDIQFACDGTFDRPAMIRGVESALPDGVHRAAKGRKYTFDDALVTCAACVAERRLQWAT